MMRLCKGILAFHDKEKLINFSTERQMKEKMVTPVISAVNVILNFSTGTFELRMKE